MLAKDLMSAPVITVPPDMAIRGAAALLLRHQVSAFPVVDQESGALLGIVSELDLLKGHLPADPRGQLRTPRQDSGPIPRYVSDVMTRDVATVSVTSDGAHLAAVMLARRVKSLPVVDGERVVGIVSRRDLLRALVRDDDAVAAEVVDRLGRHHIEADWQVLCQDGVVTLTGPDGDQQRKVALAVARTVPGAIRVDFVSMSAGGH